MIFYLKGPKSLLPKSKAEYSKLVIRELKFFCQQRKITGISNKNKNELIAMLIIEYDNNSFHRSMSQELDIDINTAQLIDVVKDVIENDDDDDLDDEFINHNEVY